MMRIQLVVNFARRIRLSTVAVRASKVGMTYDRLHAVPVHQSLHRTTAEDLEDNPLRWARSTPFL